MKKVCFAGSQSQQAPVAHPAAPTLPTQSQGGFPGCQATCTDIAPDGYSEDTEDWLSSHERRL